MPWPAIPHNLNGPDVPSGPAAASIWGTLLAQQINYAGGNIDAFEKNMREKAPAWSAFDIRMMFQRYLERGFTAEAGDLITLEKLLGHPPRHYEDFARETVRKWGIEI